MKALENALADFFTLQLKLHALVTDFRWDGKAIPEM
jgi:hypothetical protein